MHDSFMDAVGKMPPPPPGYRYAPLVKTIQLDWDKWDVVCEITLEEVEER